MVGATDLERRGPRSADRTAAAGNERPEERWASARARLGLIGDSAPFCDAMRTVERLGACEATVLVLGETGTGKELAARAMHYLGRRSDAPFVPVNCGAIPETLAESELFGHVRGAFTDAREQHAGLVNQAEGGTLFLDELETLCSRAQVALLRFLQEREYRPVGGNIVHKANARVISASNVDLAAMVKAGLFRSDLFYRLQVLTVELPPLRERGNDVLRLADAFIERFCSEYRKPRKVLTDATRSWLREQTWPGNVRELENLVHRAVVLSDEVILDLRPAFGFEPTPEAQGSLTSSSFREAKALAITTFERAYIVELLERANGNLSLAARLAGKERSRLGRLLKKYGVAREAFRR